MTRKTISRAKAKINFLKSDYVAVSQRYKPYFEKVIKAPPPHYDTVRSNTVGRGVEKRRLELIATEEGSKQIIEETIEKMKEIYAPSAEKLGEMHKSLINLMVSGINAMTQDAKDKKRINPKDLKDYREMTKAEKLEPTKVNKLDADNLSAAQAIIMISPEVGDILGVGKKK